VILLAKSCSLVMLALGAFLSHSKMYFWMSFIESGFGISGVSTVALTAGMSGASGLAPSGESLLALKSCHHFGLLSVAQPVCGNLCIGLHDVSTWFQLHSPLHQPWPASLSSKWTHSPQDCAE